MGPDYRLMPENRREQLAQATLKAMTRIRREDPELWARIERRAAEIRAEKNRGQMLISG